MLIYCFYFISKNGMDLILLLLLIFVKDLSILKIFKLV